MCPFGSAARQAEWHSPMNAPSAPRNPVGRRARENAHRLNRVGVLVRLGGLQSALSDALACWHSPTTGGGTALVQSGRQDMLKLWLFLTALKEPSRAIRFDQARKRNPPNPERAREALRPRFTCRTANVFRAGRAAGEQARLMPRERRRTIPRQTVIKSAGAHG
jgi:hypothetical protein